MSDEEPQAGDELPQPIPRGPELESLIPDHIGTVDVLNAVAARLQGTEFTVALNYVRAAIESLPN